MSQEQEEQSPGPRQQPGHGSPPPGQVWVLAGPRWTDVQAGRPEAAGPAGTPSPPAATRESPPPGHNYANPRLRPPRACETPSRKRGPPARPLRPAPRPGPARAPSSGRWGAAGRGRPSPAPEGPGGPGPRRSPEGGAAVHGHSPAADTHWPWTLTGRKSGPPPVSTESARRSAPRPPQPSRQPDVRTQRGRGLRRTRPCGGQVAAISARWSAAEVGSACD